MIQPNATGRALRRAASGMVLVLAVALAACGGGENTGREETGREDTGQGEATREVEVVGRYPLPGRPLLTQGIAYGEETGDFFVGSAADGAVFRGNVADEGEEAEVFRGAVSCRTGMACRRPPGLFKNFEACLRDVVRGLGL